MSDKLSDCPFCGNEAETEKIEEGCYGVGCGYCDFQLMSGNVGIGWHESEAAAITAWNRRASPAPAIPATHWQPIETAPKDGTVVLLWLRSPWSEPRIAWWYESWENWQPQGTYPHPTEDDMSGIGSKVPTHWMPLPVDPTDDTLKAAPAISESELTEAMIDAARPFFLGRECGCTTIEGMRKHFELSGIDASALPKWFSEGAGHLTKAGQAIIVWHLMDAARKGEKS